MWLSIYYLYCLSRTTPSPTLSAIKELEMQSQQNQHHQSDSEPVEDGTGVHKARLSHSMENELNNF